MRACHGKVECDSPRRVTLKSHNDGLVGMGCEDLPREACIADTIGHRAHGILQVKLAVVIARLFALGKVEKQVAQWHIRLLVLVYSQHLLCRCLGLGVLASLKQFSYRGEMPVRVRVVVAVGTAAPERVFVQLQTLLVDPAVDHGTKSSVTDRQRFSPLRCGLRIPEPWCIRRGIQGILRRAVRFAHSGAGNTNRSIPSDDIRSLLFLRRY